MTSGRYSTAPVASPLRLALEAVLDLIFPARCLLCGQPAANSLCDSCADGAVVPLRDPVCPTCGHTRPALPCMHCMSDPPKFVASRSAGAFDGDLQHLIHLLKYRDKPQLAIPLGRQLAKYARYVSHSLGDLDIDLVTAVPMRRSRQRRRGYNQSDRLARVVAAELGLRYQPDVLVRTRSVRPQMQLGRAQRLSNLIGVFAAGSASVAGSRILLIDDVSTTSATFKECAAILKEAGSGAVYCLSLAAD